MFDLIVNPFITILTLLYGLFGNNIVLAIAVFTVGIRLLTSPLLLQQQKSTKAMQELQPQLQALKEKHKNDREKLAQEQMELYKKAGVNPLGGCLPLFIQLPILLALYQAIIHGLAGTPFQLIDLSQRLIIPGLDSYVPLNNTWLGMDLTLAPTANPSYALILPALVMVTSWLQSKLTIPSTPASSGDDGPANQAAAMTKSMTTIMPLMFGFFSLSFSVGLSIYFVVSNTVGIAQYSMMGRADWSNLFGGNKDQKSAPAKATSADKGKAVSGKKASVPTEPVVTTTASAPSSSNGASAPRQSSGRKNKKDKKMRKPSASTN